MADIPHEVVSTRFWIGFLWQCICLTVQYKAWPPWLCSYSKYPGSYSFMLIYWWLEVSVCAEQPAACPPQAGQPPPSLSGLPHSSAYSNVTCEVWQLSHTHCHMMTELCPVFLLISSPWLSGGMSKKRGRYVETKLLFMPFYDVNIM